MFKKIVSLAVLSFLLSSSAFAAEAYIGRFIYRYESGAAYRVIAQDSHELVWECIEGPEKGAKGTERPDRFKINKTTYFVTWTEKSGIQVSQALDFKNKKVYSTIIDGKDRYVVKGKITREK